MHPPSTNILLRASTGALRSPKAFINAIMLSRALGRHATAGPGEKQSSPLRLNSTAVNVSREAAPAGNLKRKLDRSMSTTSNLESLHQQSFDENSALGFIDLTAEPPVRDSDVRYPSLDELDSISYPSLPPPPKGSQPPSSSGPVPWSSSPDSHYVNPKTRAVPQEPPSPRGVRPFKKRSLPSSFTSAAAVPASSFSGGKDDRPRQWGYAEEKKSASTASNGKTGRFDKFSAPKQFAPASRSDKASSAMENMMEKASVRQRTSVSMSRTTSDKSTLSTTKPAEVPKHPNSRVPEIFLSEEQRTVIKAVMDEGKSVFFTGSAGTGKSVLMRAIIAQLKHKFIKESERIAITASTGLASCILEGQTLHSWAGIGLGKEPVPELLKKIKKNQKSRARWLKAKVLVIDEISMVDGQLFDKLEQLARSIRNNGRPFGGIQLVVTGDFFQLPPVPDKNAGAKFVFDAQTWITCIEHTILLTHVFRQKDEHFARMLNEMRLGQMSAATVREFKSLSRPLNFHDDLEATELYPRREEVENANQNRMRKLSGQIMTFQAVDSGVQDLNVRKNLLSNFIAPEILELKKGSQVMLIKNIDTQLVNGSLGIVQSFMDEGTFHAYKDDEPTFLLAQEPDDGENESDKAAARQKIQAARVKNMGTGVGSPRLWPMVRFNLPDGTCRSFLCAPDEWKTESQQGEVIAKRVQVPLILAWALSIHKAQGQTLNRVKVDLGKVFEKGQAYVALSRARSKEGLQVLRFDERKVMVHPRVLNFYDQLSGHETLKEPRTTTTLEKHLGKDSAKHATKGPAEEDEFGEDFDYEEMLEFEQLSRAGGV